MQIPLSQILITDRQRLEMDEEHVQRLMDSFKDIGQVQAVLVHHHTAPDSEFKYSIIAGATRCTAAMRLGWTHIRGDVVDSQQATSVAIQKAEYVENALRRNLPWQDECLALAKINSLIKLERALAGEDWTQRMLAVFSGYKQPQIHVMLKVAEALKADPRDEEIWNAGGFTPAMQIILARVDMELTKRIEQLAKEKEVQEQPQTTSTVTDDAIESAIAQGDDNSFIPTPQHEEPKPVEIKHYINCPPPSPVSLIIELYNEETPFPAFDYKEKLKPGGFLALINLPIREWEGAKNYAKSYDFHVMPFPVIWDRSVLSPVVAWPFVPNHSLIMLIQKPNPGVPPSLPTNPCTSIVCSFAPEGREIPIAVVSLLTTAICTPGEPVLNPDGTAVEALVELGHPPVYNQDQDQDQDQAPEEDTEQDEEIQSEEEYQ